jgi:hypothetical protein
VDSRAILEVEVKRKILVPANGDDPARSVTLMTELSRKICSACSTLLPRIQFSGSVGKYLSLVPQFQIDLLDTMVLFSVPLEFNLIEYYYLISYIILSYIIYYIILYYILSYLLLGKEPGCL